MEKIKNRKTLNYDDLQMVIEHPQLIPQLKTLIDINTIKKMSGNPPNEKTTFLRELLPYVINTKDIKSYLEQLEFIHYPFSLLDIQMKNKIYVCGETASSNYVELFDFFKQKEFDFKDIASNIATSFKNCENDLLVDYIDKNIVSIKLDNIKHKLSSTYLEDPLERIKDDGYRVTEFLSKKHIREEQARQQENINYVVNFMNTLPDDKVEELLTSIRPNFSRLQAYMHKNSLPILLSEEKYQKDYLKEFKKAPPDWFTSCQLKVISFFENKLNKEYVDRNPHSALERFNQLKRLNNQQYQGTLTLKYKDGSKDVIGSGNFIKTIKKLM